jgi:hypothetical protein
MLEGSATSTDADLILKLYQLRTEAVMRQARSWVLVEFWPETAEDFFAIFGNMSLPQNHWLRQVVSYWEMASAMVLRGALHGELFLDCHNEPFFLLAKFMPLLPEIRTRFPNFFVHTEKLVQTLPAAGERFEQMLVRVEMRRGARKANG